MQSIASGKHASKISKRKFEWLDLNTRHDLTRSGALVVVTVKLSAVVMIVAIVVGMLRTLQRAATRA